MNDLTRYKLLAEAKVSPAAKLLYSYLMDRAGGRHGSVVVVRQKAGFGGGSFPFDRPSQSASLAAYRTPSDYGSLFRRRHSPDQSNHVSVREGLS